MYVCKSFRLHLYDWVPKCPVLSGTFLFIEGMSHDHFSGCYLLTRAVNNQVHTNLSYFFEDQDFLM